MANSAVDAMGSSQREFRVGKVFSTSFSVFFRNFITLSIVAAVIWAPLALVVAYASSVAASGGDPTVLMWAGGLVVPLTLLLAPISTSIILYAAFQDMRGKGINIGESIKWGLSRFLPVLGTSILMMLGVMAGMVALIIPGIILMVMWYVCIPACVVERTGPVESLSRSSELTKGNRWKVLAMALLVGIAIAILGNVIQAVAINAGLVVFVVVLAVWQGVAQAFNAVFVVVTYHDLRVAKEGIDVERIASVFD